MAFADGFAVGGYSRAVGMSFKAPLAEAWITIYPQYETDPGRSITIRAIAMNSGKPGLARFPCSILPVHSAKILRQADSPKPAFALVIGIVCLRLCYKLCSWLWPSPEFIAAPSGEEPQLRGAAGAIRFAGYIAHESTPLHEPLAPCRTD